jgi:hypothetical protein
MEKNRAGGREDGIGLNKIVGDDGYGERACSYLPAVDATRAGVSEKGMAEAVGRGERGKKKEGAGSGRRQRARLDAGLQLP